jgi:hypothetical protein
VLRAEVDSLNEDLERTGRFGLLVGRSQAMNQIYQQIARVAGTSSMVPPRKAPSAFRPIGRWRRDEG